MSSGTLGFFLACFGVDGGILEEGGGGILLNPIQEAFLIPWVTFQTASGPWDQGPRFWTSGTKLVVGLSGRTYPTATAGAYSDCAPRALRSKKESMKFEAITPARNYTEASVVRNVFVVFLSTVKVFLPPSDEGCQGVYPQ